MEKEIIEKYRKSGDILRKVLLKAIDIVTPGKKLLDICETLESYIITLGGKPAFPVNISINDVAAHYTADINDILEIPEKGLVKVDAGVHIDGYITDAAITIPLSENYGVFLEAVYEALRIAIKKIRPGIRLGYLGLFIENSIRKYGLNPISNLTGHLISRYNLHAGKSVPNIGSSYGAVVKPGEVYAIEPFATNGYGEVEEGYITVIFKLERNSKSKKLGKLIESKIRENFDHLPFAKRWLLKVFDPMEIEEIIRKGLKSKALRGYPVLKEVTGGMVSQVEDTIIVSEENKVYESVGTLEIFKEIIR